MSFLNNILPKSQDKEYFLTVGIEEHRITATVACIFRKEITIIGSGQSEFVEGSEETEAADIAISAAEKKIGEDILVQKVIFGLPVSFLDGDEINAQHLSKLKKITKTLSLVPCGFVEYPQALSFYLEAKEESPPTLLLLSTGSKQITFSHIRVGKVEKNVLADKTSSLTEDFEKALTSFASSEILPSRILLYDESGKAILDDLKEELLKFPWHKHSTFLHTPKIETLETSALSYALVEAAGKSLVKNLKLDEEEKLVTKIQDEETPQEFAEETFGFVKGQDVKEKILEEKKPEEKETRPVKMEVEEFEELPRLKFSLPQFRTSLTPFITAGISIILFLLLVLFVFWYFPAATINLIVYPASSTSNVDVLFTASADTAKSAKNSILTTESFVEVTGEKTAPTSGKTKIGEKAMGVVTIYNKTTSGKTFPKGTQLFSENLKFTLNDEITVASASDTGEGLTFGKTSAKITASDIGPEGNLASGTNFYFQSFDKSSYYAKNADKLSGGTSREISSVSKEDQDKLLNSLNEELVTGARQSLAQKLKTGDKLLDTSLSTSILSKQFDKNTGEEAKELSLSLKLKVSSFTYNGRDLLSLTQENNAKVPDGFEIASDKTNIRILEAKTDKKGDVLGKAVITYYFLPQIDTDNIRREINGKSFNQADQYLSRIKEIGGVEIITQRKIPLFTNRIPLRSENIKVQLVSR